MMTDERDDYAKIPVEAEDDSAKIQSDMDGDTLKRPVRSGKTGVQREIRFCSIQPDRDEEERLLSGLTYAPWCGGAAITGYRRNWLNGTKRSVTIPRTVHVLPVIAIADEAFAGAWLEEILLPDTIRQIGCRAFAASRLRGSMVLPEGVEALGAAAFADCSGLMHVALPETLASVGVNPFQGCNELREISVSAYHPRLASIQGALYDKERRRLIAWPMGRRDEVCQVPAGILEIGSCAFSGLMRDIRLPEGLRSIGNSAFGLCIRLESLRIPDSVQEIGANPFAFCDALRRIEISPQHSRFIWTGEMLIDRYEQRLIACLSAARASTCQVPEDVRDVGAEAFLGCTGLQRIVLPRQLERIGSYAFDGCSSLLEIDLPQTLREIGAGAFGGCVSLRRLAIPAETERIAPTAFVECENLTLGVFKGSAAERVARLMRLPVYWQDELDWLRG